MSSRTADLRVAIVDDDPLTRELVTHALLQIGITPIASAEDGRQALALLDDGPIDVFVCDLNMPGMDGIELLRHLADRADAPALAMISGDEHILRIASGLGQVHRLRVLGTIPKPATPAVLQTVLDRIGTDSPPPIFDLSTSNILDAAEVLAMVPDALELHYQPLIDLSTGRAVAVEALARLRHGNGLLGPAVFVPLFEQRGMSLILFRAVLGHALGQLSLWRDGGIDVRMCVNVSADDLDDVNLVQRVLTDAERAAVPIEAITLELTETRVLPEATGPIEILSRLRMRGVGLSIDDYGTGFSSLQRLRSVPFNELKIDQAFVSNSTTDDQARTMVASTVRLGQELGLGTVAEGVESAEQQDLMLELGCDLAQGFHIAMPMDAKDVTAWLERNLA